MKLLHIADLHIGKRVNEYSMIDDQEYILNQIIQMAADEQTSGILITGDVYDKSQPSTEAVELLDELLTQLTSAGQSVFMISGNHDSPERLGFGSRMLQKNKLHIAGVFSGTLQKAVLTDEHGAVNIYLLPFLKPAMLKPYFDPPPESYDDSVRMVLGMAETDPAERNILLAHQFVVNGTQRPEQSESESVSVGGLDSVEVSAFDAFDYVALGHLHGPQHIGRDSVRYAGSPLKYSFSEVRHTKSVTLLNLGAKGEMDITQLPLKPLHDLREIKGPIAELIRVGKEEPSSDYIKATLTDEDEVYDALGRLRQVYPHMMVLDFANRRTGSSSVSSNAPSVNVKRHPVDLFNEFFSLQNKEALNEQQLKWIERIFEEAGGSVL